MPNNKCLLQAKLLDDPRYIQWFKKEKRWSDIAATAKTYVFNIWYRCFYFYICRYCTALLKTASFVDLNPLGACVA